MKQLLLLTFLLLFWVPGSAFGADASSEEEETVILNFNDVDIHSVIKSVARITGRNFVLDQRVKGKVTIISSQPMRSAEVYAVFLSVLQVHELAAIEVGEIVKIVPYDQARTDIIPSYMDDEISLRPEDRSVTRVYKLQHVQAERLVGILKPLLAPKSYIAAHPESNIMILSDRAANIDRIINIIKRIDQAEVSGVEAVRLQYAAARDVANAISALIVKAQKKGAEADFRIVADERTNTILMSGDGQEMLRARTIIAHLDEPVATEGDTQVIFLRFSRAKDLAPMLSTLGFDEEQKAKDPKAVKKPNLKIQGDEGTNALIITAPPAIMKELRNVIAKLDIRRAQVMIEAVIAEISVDKTSELGFQFRSMSEVTVSGDKGITKSGSFGGSNFSTRGSSINAVSEDPLKAAGDGFTFGYFDGTTTILGKEILNLGALVRLLESTGDTNILSTPTLVTMDNEEAVIIVGENIPFVTSRRTSTTADSSYDLSVERHDVGLKLKVKPQISEGNTIMLEIEQEASDVKDSTGTEGYWTTNTRSIKTRVMVEDGKLLILGGLIRDNVQEGGQKIPFLGDIPYLGALFRYTYTSHNKTNLLVFLKPVIMRDESTSASITYDKYDYMRNLQKVHSKVITPTMYHLAPPMLPEESGQQAGSEE